MMSTKLISGGSIPAFTLSLVGGGQVTLGKVSVPGRWQIVIVYRGLHCPICNKYLARLEELVSRFAGTKAEIVAISGDPSEKAEAIVRNNGLTFPVAYGLSLEQMKELNDLSPR
jgi:peroxiredoxin